jgi:hypothetical protein
MRVLAYCCASYRLSVRRAAGVEPLLCPPAGADTFDPAWLSGQDLIYVKLHGMPGQGFWYGDDWVTALSAAQVRGADLGGAVVFVTNCYLPESPMLDALRVAGARAIVGGSGQNYAGKTRVFGADLLGLIFRQLLAVGLGPESALRMAKARLRLGRDRVSRDTLEFGIYL